MLKLNIHIPISVPEAETKLKNRPESPVNYPFKSLRKEKGFGFLNVQLKLLSCNFSNVIIFLLKCLTFKWNMHLDKMTSASYQYWKRQS